MAEGRADTLPHGLMDVDAVPTLLYIPYRTVLGTRKAVVAARVKHLIPYQSYLIE